jgi:Tfp pilus assembly protein PilX
VLAMLFLVLFSTLAVGFYVSSTMSAQISRNDRYMSLAQAAADAGTQFVRYQFDQMTIPPNPPNLLTACATALNSQIGGTANMNNTTVSVTTNTITVNGVQYTSEIYVPGSNSWTTVDPNTGTKFKAVIVQAGTNLVATVDGAGPSATVTKAILLQYNTAPKAGAILNYGVASAGTVATAGASYINGATDPTKGSVLSADMSNLTPVSIGGKAVSGDISVVNPSATIAVSGASIGGTSNPALIPQHEHFGVPDPTFPWIDTSPYVAAANASSTPMTVYAGGNVLTNVIIPPNTNPRFNGGATINGVLVIQSPNIVTFRGNATINGVIIQAPGASPVQTPISGASFDPANNQISFGGTVTATPLSALPTNNPAYDPNLVKLGGAFLLAPNFALSATGNFGTIGGSIVAGTVSMSGNATGTVEGSVIAVYDSSVGGSSSSVYLNGSSDIVISSTGTTNYPTGMSFGNNFTPLPGTYMEVTPW